MLARALIVGAISVGAATIAHAQQAASEAELDDWAKHTYETYCAECHGLTGKGGGPYLKLLASDVVVPDLTEIAKKNGGLFPILRVYKFIDGTGRSEAHHPAIMPSWGAVYRNRSRNLNRNPNYNHQEYVRERIAALTQYIYRLQVK